MRLFIFLILIAALCGSVSAESWETFESKAFGFSFLARENTVFVEKDWGGGWKGLYFEKADLVMAGIVSGKKQTEADIIAFVAKATGFPVSQWKELREAEYEGLTWSKDCYVYNDKLYAAIIFGIGPKGSYVFFAKGIGDTGKGLMMTGWFESVSVK